MIAALNKLIPNAFIFPLFVIATAVFIFVSRPVEGFPDVYWHIFGGDYIRAHGVPQFDPWAAGNQDQNWFNISWLFDIVLSHIVEWFSIEGLSLVRSLAYAFVACIIFRNIYARNVGLEVTLIVTAAVCFVMVMFLSARPHIVTYALALIFHHILHRSREQNKIAYILPLWMILWVNCHGGFLIGFLLFGAYGVEALISQKTLWLKHLIAAGVLCVVATLINPLGLGLVEASILSMDSFMTEYIREWQPTAPFGDMTTSIFFLIFLISTNLNDPKISIADKIVAFGFLLLGLDSVRNFPLFAILAAPYVAICISNFKPIIEQDIEKTARTLKGKIIAIFGSAACLCAILFLGNGNPNASLVKMNGLKEAVEYAVEKYPEKNFFNHYNEGGPILLYGKGKLKHFIDGRADTAFSRDRLRDNITLTQTPEEPDELFEKWKLNAVLIESENQISKYLQHNKAWFIAYKNEDHTIFIKK
jgi:hypothetical protein